MSGPENYIKWHNGDARLLNFIPGDIIFHFFAGPETLNFCTQNDKTTTGGEFEQYFVVLGYSFSLNIYGVAIGARPPVAVRPQIAPFTGQSIDTHIVVFVRTGA